MLTILMPDGSRFDVAGGLARPIPRNGLKIEDNMTKGPPMTAAPPPAPKRTRRKVDAVIALSRIAKVLDAIPETDRVRALVVLGNPPDDVTRRCEAVLRQLSADDRAKVLSFLKTTSETAK